MDNPLLNQGPLPQFSPIVPEKISPLLKEVIQKNREKLTELLTVNTNFSWDTLVEPIEELDDRLNKMWAPIAHLHSVMETEELRNAYNICLPLLTEYHTETLQNEMLYRAFKSIAESPEYQNFTAEQCKLIENELRDFRLAGVELNSEDKERFADLIKKLSKLTTQFAENLLDATDGWSLHITDQNALRGLPEPSIKLAEMTADNRGKSGWVFTLDYPSYSTILKFLERRDLRKEMYEAYATRASDQGPNANRWDNTYIMEDILKTRYELARILKFSSFAEYSLTTKMANNPERVLTFLNGLVERSKPFAEAEMQELRAFAKMSDGIENLEAWDIPFYTEKLREEKFAISQEELRAYFPIDQVLQGMFTVVERLFGIKIIERLGIDTWHPSVQFFEVMDNENNLRGCFYTDLYARPHKKDGAWMDDCRVRRLLPDGTVQHPVAFLTCNFSRPLENQSALLTHEDVQTLFHEFGHCLHHLLSKVNYSPLSGINGVPWDAVEFPSQFLEHWCWDFETLQLISCHIKTKQKLPYTLYQKLIAAKNFQAGMHMLRQLEFALFDFRLHLEYDPEKEFQVQEILNSVRHSVAVVPIPSFNRFQHSFSHIFAGGYAAGYYSYKWAEVLSSDAFSLFEEKGIYDRPTGQSFMQNILEKGGVHDPMKLFIAFRGREPTIDALLRHSGL